MSITYNNYIAYMKNPNSAYQLLAKFELLHSDETVYQTFQAQVIGGSLTVNRANGVRRSVAINVHNINNLFTPDPMKFWVNDKFKLSLGYVINGEVYYREHGVYGLRNPSTSHEDSQQEAAITGIDKFAFLNGTLNGRLNATYTILRGTSVRTAISAILSLCNDNIPPLILIDPSIVTPYTIYKEAGETYADILLELNTIVAGNMFYDATGRFVCEPDIPNTEKGCSFDFEDNLKVPIYSGINLVHDFESAYNIVMVIADNVAGNIATGIATNNDPTSSLSVLSIGEKLAPIIRNSVIDTDERAQDLANYEIKRYASMSVEGTITSIPLIELDVDEVVTVTDVREKLDKEKFLINSITMPLSPQSGQQMQIGVSKLTEIDFEITN
jgi:hypothetical protein